jgi:predicted metal-dependent hydrolase
MQRQTLPTRQGILEYTLVHRPRVTRRMHLELDKSGGLMVVVPENWPRRQVEAVLKNNAGRVERFLHTARQRQCESLQFKHGEKHLFLGGAYPLHIHHLENGKRGVSFDRQRIQISCPQNRAEQIQASLHRWYLQQAREVFPRRLALVSARAPWLDGREVPLRIRKMKRTWGNCSCRGEVKLNTHLIKAPLHVIDSVIAHELCHLREMNHGPAFYELLQGLNPDWRSDRQVLRSQGNLYLR